MSATAPPSGRRRATSTVDGSASGPFIERMFRPVDISSIVVFRILFGAIMAWEVTRYFSNGWISRYFIDPAHLFPFYGFEWVKPWGGNGMYIHFSILGALALCILVGLFYRTSTALFFLGFTYIFLLDQTRYLNHFYLVSLISFLLPFIPAHRSFSLDARWGDGVRSSTIPAWSLWTLRAQIGIAYFFGGIAKLNSDWLQGEPMRMWLAERTDFPLIGHLFREEWMVWFFSYGGMFLDLLIVPALLWKRTRLPAFIAAVAFHFLNSLLFQIGIFPWFMLGATLLFFPPDWPRRLIRRIRRTEPVVPTPSIPETRTGKFERPVAYFLGAWLLLECVIPLRHYLYPGDVNWTEEGHNFSWHMKLRDKDGKLSYTAVDSSDEWEIDPLDYVSERQLEKIATTPDMIVQLAHYIGEDLRRKGHPHVQIHATSMAALNGRPFQRLVDPSADLASTPLSLAHAPWILPLIAPLDRSASEQSGRHDEE